jgi:hypothetical protein
MGSHGAKAGEPARVAIAPIWHTSFLIALFLAPGTGQIARSRTASPPPAVPFYLGTIAFEWILFAYIWWGIRLKWYSLAALVSRDRRWFGGLIVRGIPYT